LKKTEPIFILITILIVGCAPQTVPSIQAKPQSPLDKIINEEINYSQYFENGFSVEYPLWPDADSDVELAVTKGYCSVAINSEKIPAKQWFKMLTDGIEKQAGSIIISDEDNYKIKYSTVYQNITLVSDNRIFVCNDKSITVTLTCIEAVDEVMKMISDRIYPSATCKEEKTEFNEYRDEDFSIEYPDWEQNLDGENRLLGVSRGVCSVIVDKHNALPKDIFNWLNITIDEKDDHVLLTTFAANNEYSVVYQFPHGESTLTADTKVFYCNYQSYVTQVICIDEYITEDDEIIQKSVLQSARCAKEYEVPTPEKTKQEKEVVKEKEPEVIEEIEDEIVNTNAGVEFGIDEEMVVYFINSNGFFKNVLKDFPKANLVVVDDDRELNLRVLINNDGEITLLEDGEYSDADVTLIVPLRDALNIFNNAQNLNPLNLIGFAINIRTEPANIKNEVIQKVLKGEYN